MNDKQILEMVEELVHNVDYNIYEEKVFCTVTLVNIVKKHLEKANVPDPTSLEARIDRFLDRKLPKE